MKVQAGRKYITRRGDIVEVKYIAGGGTLTLEKESFTARKSSLIVVRKL